MKLHLLIAPFLLFQSMCASDTATKEEQSSQAKNPSILHVFPEAGSIQGWISGTENLKGQKVTLKTDAGEQELVIGKDNRFEWQTSSLDEQAVTLTFGEQKYVASIPSRSTTKPVVFFVVDRSVYRPETELQFAAYLREMDREGEFRPITDRSYEVEIQSTTKKITVATLPLKTDDFGRITGSYTFSSADPLDDYSIRIKDVGGSAMVKLAEFRKAKVRLNIESERKDDVLTLRFQARDFLNKPVPASSVRFTARVVQTSTPPFDLWGLDPNQYFDREGKDISPWEMPTAEQIALIRSGVARPGQRANDGDIHIISEELEIRDEHAEYEISLDPSWQTDHALEIEATLIDANNREQHASQRIELSQSSEETIKLELPQSDILIDEEITLKAETSTDQAVSFVLLRLDSSQPNYTPMQTGFRPHIGSQINHHSQIRSSNWIGSQPNQDMRADQLSDIDETKVITRNYVTILPSKKIADGNYESKLRLKIPGAYIIQAFAHDSDGILLRSEQALAVRSKESGQQLRITLKSDQLKRTEPIRGTISCAYDNARILLSIRDGNGLQIMHPITCKKGDNIFEIFLPNSLSVGCEISAGYSDDGIKTHIITQPFYVAPKDKEMKITTVSPEVAEPGEEVEIQISVDRKEAVDLVVSVYDQSLLGIGPDRPVDARSLFHADLRIDETTTENALRVYLGGLTLAAIQAQLEEILKEDDKPITDLRNRLSHLHSHLHNKTIDENAVRTLLAWRGAPVGLQIESGGYWHIQLSEEDMRNPVHKLLNRTGVNAGTNLHIHKFGEIIAIWVTRQSDGYVQILSGDPAIHYSQYPYNNYYGRGINLGGWGGAGAGFGESFREELRSSNRRSLRGDGHFSQLTMNASFSTLSGQAMISHLPAEAIQIPAQSGGSVPIRRDFSDSAFFDAKVRTNEQGKAVVRFKLPDSLTNWRVVVTGVSRDLHIARHTDAFKTFKPVMVWPMLSQSFTSGDRSKIFATVHNHTDKEQRFTVSAEVKNGMLHGTKEQIVSVAPNSNEAVYFDYEAGKPGLTEILMTAICKAGQDASLKRLPVNPCTAEQVITRSGFVNASTSFEIPEDIDLSQAKLEVTVVPSLAGDMMDSLDYLVGYPHGCVEQTMSRFLPVIKVAQILEKFEVEDEKLKKMVPEYANAGIKRLLELQQADGGWGWNGTSQTHEMMTPYALLGLIEAEKAGFEIPNKTAIPRGIERLKGFISSMGENQSSDRIYCMWVYQHHAKLSDDWWQWLEGIVDRTLGTDADRSKLLSDYAAAMAMEMAAEKGKVGLANKLERLLAYRAKRSGNQVHWTTANFSSWGNDRFEITAAVLKSFAAHDPNHPIVPKILSYFATTKRGKQWNSTKDTAMILYAMCDYLSTQEQSQSGSYVAGILVNGQLHELKIPDWKPATLTIKGDDLKVGKTELGFKAARPNQLYRMVFRYWKDGKEVEATQLGASVSRRFYLSDKAGKYLKQLNSGDRVPRGSFISSIMDARLDEGLFNFSLAVNPKPSCAEYTTVTENSQESPHVLKEAKASGTYWHHETGSQSLQNGCVYRVELDGEFLIAPAYVELMYDTEIRGNSSSFRLIVGDDPE